MVYNVAFIFFSVCLYFFSSFSIHSFDVFLLVFTLQESSNPSYILNPCYVKGFNSTLKASSIYGTTCTKKPENYDPKQEFFMVGTGDSDECGNIVKSIFDFKNCSSSHCSFNGVEQPPVTGDFMVTQSANTTSDKT